MTIMTQSIAKPKYACMWFFLEIELCMRRLFVFSKKVCWVRGERPTDSFVYSLRELKWAMCGCYLALYRFIHVFYPKICLIESLRNHAVLVLLIFFLYVMHAITQPNYKSIVFLYVLDCSQITSSWVFAILSIVFGMWILLDLASSCVCISIENRNLTNIQEVSRNFPTNSIFLDVSRIHTQNTWNAVSVKLSNIYNLWAYSISIFLLQCRIGFSSVFCVLLHINFVIHHLNSSYRKTHS